MLNVGVIGYGYWGPNLVRNFMTCAETAVVMVADRSAARLEAVRSLYPSVEVMSSAQDLIEDQRIDVVVIATPVSSHFDLAMAALGAGKHVWVEKPIASTSAQARLLMEEADRRGRVLLVDHTFVYTGAVRKMRELVNKPEFGPVRYFDSTRVNLGLFQNDVNVLWDLAVHDLSILAYVIDEVPVAVSATGHTHLPGDPEYAAFLTLFFDGGMIAHINVNWLSPVKVRRTLIGGGNQMVVYDDLETSEKIKLYDKGITVTETPDDKRKQLIGYRTGDLWSPKVAEAEALGVEVAHFVQCVRDAEQPLTGGDAGLRLVRILEAADQSMAGRGVPVTL